MERNHPFKIGDKVTVYALRDIYIEREFPQLLGLTGTVISTDHRANWISLDTSNNLWVDPEGVRYATALDEVLA